MIDFGNGQHKAIVGMTGTGKTFTTSNMLKSVKQGVFFFNSVHVQLPKQFTRATGSADLESLMYLIEEGEKINFLPNTDMKNKTRQLAAIINGLYDRKWDEFIFVVDEVQLYKGEGLTALLTAATSARNQGVEMVSMCQRLANMDNTIMTQSPYKVLFLLENETKYCESYGIPYADMEPRIKVKDPGGINPQTGKWEPSHAYCTYFMGQVGGAFKYGTS